MSDLFETEKPMSRAMFIGRDYQIEAHDKCFELWDSGVTGVLIRSATGTGKTPMSCLIADTWMNRSRDHRVMVISYETQLVDQFAQEIEDFLGITPMIEMEKDHVDMEDDPRIIVASRASLLRAIPPSKEELETLAEFGINDVGACPQRMVKRFIKALTRGIDIDDVRDEIQRINSRPEAHEGHWSRVHKFHSWLNWLVIYDEAHRHAYYLKSIKHIVDWFDENKNSKRLGLTATPKRSDEISIGDKMFPGIALDYPLYSADKRCAVRDGWAVEYVQKYIEVSGVDFKQIAKIAGDFDENELERILGEESQLATLVEPLLDMVDNRPTLIFSPGIEMAKNVARYINARSRCVCSCGNKTWFPTLLIGDGAKCKCGRMVESSDIDKHPDQAREIDGNSPTSERNEVYRAHRCGEFQFLSVCGLCREGYNSPNISCVAVFRPVSEKASSLAEQMKGRGCRPLKGILANCKDAEERLCTISNSEKPNCLIVDLVGITGLADCASTVQIYAEGLPDEVKELAIDLLAERAKDQEVNVEDLIEEAKRQVAEEKERIRQERENAERIAKEEFERRAKANASVEYTQHEVGYGSSIDPNEASPNQHKFIRWLGLDIHDVISKRQAGRIIDMIKSGRTLVDVIRENRLREVDILEPSFNQKSYIDKNGLHKASTPYEASLIIGAHKNPSETRTKFIAEFSKVKHPKDLTAIGHDLRLVKDILSKQIMSELVKIGVEIKKQFESSEIPD